MVIQKVASLIIILGVSSQGWAADAIATANSSSSALSSSNVKLVEEGKTLYKDGQSLQALNRFMTVLKQDPRNNEARKYLRLAVEEMRKNGGEKSGTLTPQQQAEYQARLQKRHLLSLDLKAIPNVKLTTGKRTYLEVDRAILFGEKSGGLREEGIPLLDRIAAWLVTFGHQPVITHIYPDEVEDPSTNNGLFLQRYAALYGFFVDERKLSAGRFVSADLLTDEGFGSKRKKEADGFEADVVTPRIVIETIGSGAYEPALQTTLSAEKTKWLEMSVFSNRASFDPQEGEWATVDLAAVTRSGLKKWHFKITPEKDLSKTVHYEEGTTNLLKRFTWEGRDQKSGSFLPLGIYIAKLTAVDADGATLSREQVLEIRTGSGTMLIPDQSVLDQQETKKNTKKSTKKKDKRKKKRGSSNERVHEAEAPRDVSQTPAETVSDPLLDAVAKTAPGETGVEEGSAGGSQAIWKQVVSFEVNSANLPGTVRPILERIAKTLEVYPLQKVRLTGFAMRSEKSASSLAKKRSQTLRQALVDDFKVNSNRMIIGPTHLLDEANAAKVEISITN